MTGHKSHSIEYNLQTLLMKSRIFKIWMNKNMGFNESYSIEKEDKILQLNWFMKLLKNLMTFLMLT
jgi:hypothetical protein